MAIKKTIYDQLTSGTCRHCGHSKEPLRPTKSVVWKSGDKGTRGTITGADIGTPYGGNFGGRVMECDVAKWVYANTTHGIIELENNPQRDKRLGRAAQSEIENS